MPAADLWFWDERLDRCEREVDAHVRAGNVRVHDTVDDLVDHLAALTDK